MKAINREVKVERCGLVIDHVNYIFGASPDGKVTDLMESSVNGIVEVKCSHEYKDNDPKDICFISKDSCLTLDASTNKLHLNKNHSYYDQVQMQLALTTQTWCDFVFYTSKRLVVDRVEFDRTHWEQLRDKLVVFYFEYLLDAIIEKNDN